MRLIAIVIAFLVLAAGPARAQDDSTKQLFAAQSLQCHFGSGISTQWSASKPRTSASDYNAYILFDAIDLKKLSAQRIVGNVTDVVNIKLLVNVSGISFLETDKSSEQGGLAGITAFSITTVFPITANGDGFVTIETRYTTVSGNVIAEQYYGTCRIWH